MTIQAGQPVPTSKAVVTVVETKFDGTVVTYQSCDLEVAPNFVTTFFEVGSDTDPEREIRHPLRSFEPTPTQYVKVNIRALPHHDNEPGAPLYTITIEESS